MSKSKKYYYIGLVEEYETEARFLQRMWGSSSKKKPAFPRKGSRIFPTKLCIEEVTFQKKLKYEE